MTFDEWYEKYERDGGELMLFNAIDLHAAFMAGADAANTLPHRAMFDEGICVGKTMAAKECVETIQQHHSLFKAGSWEQLALNGAAEKIEDKFQLTIRYR